MSRWAFLSVLVAALIPIGASDCQGQDAQALWEVSTGQDWENFQAGYDFGWGEGCDLAFADSPDGYLYDQGERFSVADCVDSFDFLAVVDAAPGNLPEDPWSVGEEAGKDAGCQYAFEALPLDAGGTLYWGEQSFDASICPGF